MVLECFGGLLFACGSKFGALRFLCIWWAVVGLHFEKIRTMALASYALEILQGLMVFVWVHVLGIRVLLHPALGKNFYPEREAA